MCHNLLCHGCDDADSACNAIFGRSWLHEMMDVPSSYHLLVNFPLGGHIEILKNVQVNT